MNLIRYCDKDVITTLQKEIQQLKKTNQSLNNQIQSLRAKESENKTKFINVSKRLDRFEFALKHMGLNDVEDESLNKGLNIEKPSISQQSPNIIPNNPHSNNKFNDYLASEENKKNKKPQNSQPQQQKKKIMVIKDNNMNAKKEENKEFCKETCKKTANSNTMNNEQNLKKPKNIFGVFNIDVGLPLLIDFICKSQEIYKEKQLNFIRVYEGSKQKFQLKKLLDICTEGRLKEGVLILIRTDNNKTLGTFFSKGLEANVAKEDSKAFIFSLDPFKVFPLKLECKVVFVILFNEEGIRLGQDLLIRNEGNKNLNSIEIPRNYGVLNEQMIEEKSFLMKEMMVFEIKIEG